MPPKTVRILSLDGGGMRGYMSSTALNRFCSDASIVPTELYNYFDIITGTSIGGIMAMGFTFGLSPSQMLSFLAEQGQNIFAYDSSLSLSAYKFAVIMGLPTYPTTFYAQAPLQAAIASVFGTTMTVGDLQTNVIIPSWDAINDVERIYSNITGFDPFLVGSSETIVNVGLATSAAPLYFPSASVSGLTLIDGGVYQNNPVTTAFSVSKQLFPGATRFCILSLGTGVSHNDFIPQMSLLKEDAVEGKIKKEFASNKSKLLQKYPDKEEYINTLIRATDTLAPYNVEYLFYLMENVFIPGPQELNASTMQFESQDVFDDIFFYRFQYQFLPGQDSSLDNYSPEQLTALAAYANTQYDNDSLEIQNFIAHFNAG